MWALPTCNKRSATATKICPTRPRPRRRRVRSSAGSLRVCPRARRSRKLYSEVHRLLRWTAREHLPKDYTPCSAFKNALSCRLPAVPQEPHGPIVLPHPIHRALHILPPVRPALCSHPTRDGRSIIRAFIAEVNLQFRQSLSGPECWQAEGREGGRRSGGRGC